MDTGDDGGGESVPLVWPQSQVNMGHYRSKTICDGAYRRTHLVVRTSVPNSGIHQPCQHIIDKYQYQ